MPLSSLEKIRIIFGETPVRNVKLLPFPITPESLPVVGSSNTLLELHPVYAPLPQHQRDLLNSDATLAAPDFALILSTGSAYRFPLMAKSLMAQFTKLHPLPNNQAWTMQTALHEIVTNAITHGNLNAGNLMRNNRDNLSALGQMLVARLKTDDYSRRYLTITLKITPKEAIWHIADDGAGFDVPTTLERIAEDPLRYSGRGIIMAQKLSSYLRFESGGRVARIAFKL